MSDYDGVNDGTELVPVETGLNMNPDDDDDLDPKARSSRSEEYPPSCFTDDKGNLKFVNLVVRRPCSVFFAILILCFVMIFMLVSVVFADGNPFTDPGNEYDVDDIRSIDYDSLRLARNEVKDDREEWEVALAEANGIPQLVRPQEEVLDITYWVFEAETDGGVFGSVESLQGMSEALTLFTENANYQDFCWKKYSPDGTSECRVPLSVLNIYYTSFWDMDIAQSIIDTLMMDYPANVIRYNAVALCVEFGKLCERVPPEYNTQEDFDWALALNAEISLLTDAWDGEGSLQEESLDQISLFCAYMQQLITKKGLMDFGFDKDFSIDNPISKFSRAVLYWGAPLALNDTDTDTETDELSEEDKQDEDEDDLKDYVVDNFLKKMNKIASSKYNPDVDSYYFMGALILEVLLDIVKQDAFLALASFLFVFLYLRTMVGSWFLACMGMTEILFSVPVSWFLYNTVFRVKYFAFLNALTLFIVAAIGADDIFIFMDAYRLSGQSKDPEILESLESRMSWVYRRTGFAMAITSATTCSAFLCTLITPLAGVQAFGVFAATVILIDYVLVMTLFCTAVVIYHNKFERPGCCSSCSAGCGTIDPSSTQEGLEKVNDDVDHKGDRISNFFRTKMSPFITNSALNRLFLGIAFVTWLVIAIIYATRITPTKEAEQFLAEDHPLQKSITILNTAFPTAEDDDGLNIHFVWGLNKVSRKGVNQLTDPEFFGTPKFLETFEFNEVCQTQMLQVCNDLKQNDTYKPYIKQAGGLGAVSCFIEELAAYSVLGSLDDCVSVVTGQWKNEVWQIPEADIPAMMQSFIYERSCYSDEGSAIIEQYKDNLGFDGTALRFAGLSVESSVIDPFSTLPEKTVREQYDKMIEISKSMDDIMMDACGGKTLMTDLNTKFVFMNTQRIYIRSAVTSSILGVCIAFAVLLIATRVFHIAFFATLSIICVLVSVTGSMVMIGWDLGSIEAILISIVAGFSVDYVVHLAHAYVQSSGDTAERITQAFGEMGISVLNGMVTSVGASIPLFFCQLQFFKKFGTFLCLTIAFSWLFANFGFMSVLAQLKIPIKEKGAKNKNTVTKHSENGLSDDQGNDGYSNNMEYEA